MKALIAVSTVALLAGAAIPAVADAQESAYSPTFYGNLGYAAPSADGVNLGAIQGRLGARFGQYLGVEGEVSGGVANDKTWVAGTPVKVNLQNQAAIYGVGYLPLAPNIDLFARVGYGETKLKASVAGTSASADGDSWNYGVGGQYFLNDKNGVRVDFTRYDQQDSSTNINVWAVSYVRKF